MLVHEVVAGQSWVPVVHSSTSAQVVPSASSSQPVMQPHSKPPTLLVQVPFVASQPSVPLLGATVIAVLAFYPIFASDENAGEYCATLFSVVAISLLVVVLGIFMVVKSKKRAQGVAIVFVSALALWIGYKPITSVTATIIPSANSPTTVTAAIATNTPPA